MNITVKLKPRRPDTIYQSDFMLPFKGPLVAGMDKQIAAQFNITKPNNVSIELPVQFTGFDRVFNCTMNYTWGIKHQWVEEKNFLGVNIRFGMISCFETDDDLRLAKDWLAQQNDRLMTVER